MLEFKPDYELAKKRIDAWWAGLTLDHPLTFITFQKPQDQQVPLPQDRFESLRDRWMDAAFQAQRALAMAANTVYYADAVPVQTPNLGPAWFAAACGCPLDFAEDTSWTSPVMQEWNPVAAESIRFDPGNPYAKAMADITAAYAEAGRGKFLVGVTPQTGAADAVAAFLDPQQMCMELIERPEEMKAFILRMVAEQIRGYDFLWRIATGEGARPSGGWLGIISDGKMYIPQNDFSSMISPDMLREFCIPATTRECQAMTRNIYHLDGLQALNHLQAVLEIPNLHAVQWGPPPQYWDWRQWVHVYKQIQAAGKGFIVYLAANDVAEFIARFPIHAGAWMYISGISNEAHARDILTRIERW